MKTFQGNRAAVILWLVMSAGLSCVVLMLNIGQQGLLHTVGAASEDERASRLDSFLATRDAYSRLLTRFHSDNPGNQPRPVLAKDPDYRTMLSLREQIRATRPSDASRPGVPVEFILSDSLWMAGSEVDANALLSGPLRH